MTNVFDELEDFFKATELTWNDVVAAEICKNRNGYFTILKRNHTEEDLELFLSQLIKMKYRKRSIDQIELLGIIWLKDNRWLERIQDHNFQEERWNLFEYPEFPEYL